MDGPFFRIQQEKVMVRRELHATPRLPDALSKPPARPHFDAIAWNAARAVADAQTADQVAALLETLQRATPNNPETRAA